VCRAHSGFKTSRGSDTCSCPCPYLSLPSLEATTPSAATDGKLTTQEGAQFAYQHFALLYKPLRQVGGQRDNINVKELYELIVLVANVV
jgi:hypothetical protein